MKWPRLPVWLKTLARRVQRDPVLTLLVLVSLASFALLLWRRYKEGFAQGDLDWAKKYASDNCKAGYTLQEVYRGYGIDGKDWSAEDKQTMKQALKEGCKEGQQRWKDGKNVTYAENSCPNGKLCPNKVLRRFYPCKHPDKRECCNIEMCVNMKAGKSLEKISKAKAKWCPRSGRANNCSAGYRLKCDRGATKGKGNKYAWRCCPENGGRCPDDVNANRTTAEHDVNANRPTLYAYTWPDRGGGKRSEYGLGRSDLPGKTGAIQIPDGLTVTLTDANGRQLTLVGPTVGPDNSIWLDRAGEQGDRNWEHRAKTVDVKYT